VHNMSAARATHDIRPDSDDEDGDFADWSSEEGGVAVRSFLPPHSELPSAPDAWEELRLHTGFDFYTFKTARSTSSSMYILTYCPSAIADSCFSRRIAPP
jgi:hypothetical protein